MSNVITKMDLELSIENYRHHGLFRHVANRLQESLNRPAEVRRRLFEDIDGSRQLVYAEKHLRLGFDTAYQLLQVMNGRDETKLARYLMERFPQFSAIKIEISDAGHWPLRMSCIAPRVSDVKFIFHF